MEQSIDGNKHTFIFHGKLESEYGEQHTVYDNNIRGCMQGLVSQLGQSFKQTIMDNSWTVIQGEHKDILEADYYIVEENVELTLFTEVIHIYPAIRGAGATARIIIGVVLIIVAVVLIFTGVGAILGGYLVGTAFTVSGIATVAAVAGIGLVAGGVQELLSKSPSFNTDTVEVEKNPSFMFNGAVNRVEQGGPVPVVCGRFDAGSTVISVSIDTLYKIANANVLKPDSAKFDTDGVLGLWQPINATITVIRGFMQIEPNGEGTGSAYIDLTTVPGQNYTFSSRINRRKHTDKGSIKLGSTEVSAPLKDRLDFASVTGKFTAASTITRLECIVQGKRALFDDVYFAETGFDYRDSPLIDIDKAEGVNPA